MEKESDLVLLGDEAEELLQNNTFNNTNHRRFSKWLIGKKEQRTPTSILN